MPFALPARMATPQPASPPNHCLHCRSEVPPGAESASFCCRGCEAVHGLLLEQGLGRYYELAGASVNPVAEPTATRSHAWLQPLLERTEQEAGPLCTLQLDVQGLECAACVWLMNETFRRRAGSADIMVNPALGTVRLRWRRGECDVARWVTDVEAFGYALGPARKQSAPASSAWPLRLGVCVALTINVMLFSLSFYFGLSATEPEVFSLFTWLSFALSTVVVAVGGWPFFQAAARGLRRGLLHLDVPIALGIALVYATSLVQLREGRGDLTYFDTLNTFITLMVLGRFLQERLLDRNRRYLLEDDGAEGLATRRVEGERLVQVPVARVAVGDVLLIAP
ncbi:MAG: heavy metal translocating P-type ATPase metal-binding domain-containing protein, partial [Archangium sp.]|nr:heavy metal translocating P-type ATPase metal-binding domain-containing protein [Archangium sp.]